MADRRTRRTAAANLSPPPPPPRTPLPPPIILPTERHAASEEERGVEGRRRGGMRLRNGEKTLLISVNPKPPPPPNPPPPLPPDPSHLPLPRPGTRWASWRLSKHLLATFANSTQRNGWRMEDVSLGRPSLHLIPPPCLICPASWPEVSTAAGLIIIITTTINFAVTPTPGRRLKTWPLTLCFLPIRASPPTRNFGPIRVGGVVKMRRMSERRQRDRTRFVFIADNRAAIGGEKTAAIDFSRCWPGRFLRGMAPVDT